MQFLIFSLIAVVLSASAAVAQTDCKTIASPTDRLACYDKIAPPAQLQTTVPSRATSPAPANRFDDPTLGDDAALRARMNNICRGC